MGDMGLGRTLIVLGAVLLLAGIVVSLAGRVPWLGRLPGDIVYKRNNFTFYFPVATSLLLSLVLTVVMWLINRR